MKINPNNSKYYLDKICKLENTDETEYGLVFDKSISIYPSCSNCGKRLYFCKIGGNVCINHNGNGENFINITCGNMNIYGVFVESKDGLEVENKADKSIIAQVNSFIDYEILPFNKNILTSKKYIDVFIKTNEEITVTLNSKEYKDKNFIHISDKALNNNTLEINGNYDDIKIICYNLSEKLFENLIIPKNKKDYYLSLGDDNEIEYYDIIAGNSNNINGNYNLIIGNDN